MKAINAGWMTWLIALGFLVVIPVLVSLGINLVVPDVNWRNYQKDRNVYVKGYVSSDEPEEKQKQYEQQEALWKESAEWQVYKAQSNSHLKTEILVGCLMMLILLIIGGMLQAAIISGSFIAASVIIYQFHVGFNNYNTNREFGAIRDIMVGGVSIVIWQMIAVFVCLLLVLWYAYRDSME